MNNLWNIHGHPWASIKTEGWRRARQRLHCRQRRAGGIHGRSWRASSRNITKSLRLLPLPIHHKESVDAKPDRQYISCPFPASDHLLLQTTLLLLPFETRRFPPTRALSTSSPHDPRVQKLPVICGICCGLGYDARANHGGLASTRRGEGSCHRPGRSKNHSNQFCQKGELFAC